MSDSIDTVAVLCGGRGTRLQSDVPSIPKPLVEIGKQPILWHVIQLYAAQGFRRAVLLTGYKHEMIEHFVAEADWPAGLEVECVNTGPDTPTGGRLALAADQLCGGTFCATYADGLANVDLAALVARHRLHGCLATVTVVRPELQFGIAELDCDDRIRGFQEKPRAEHWVNGGFFCFEPETLDYMQPSSILECGPLVALAADGQLHAYRHSGFWDCMDTYKDAILLNDLWHTGDAPWTRLHPAG